MEPVHVFLLEGRRSGDTAATAYGELQPSPAEPEGIRLVYLPPYTPELQPAETLWVHVDEPIVNRYFETLDDLDAAVAAQCVALNSDRDLIRGQTGFHWWPDRVAPI